MMTVPTLMDDDRTIEALFFDDDDGTHVRVGSSDITSIIAYGEPVGGDFPDYQYAPYFAIYKGEHLSMRVPALKVTVLYEQIGGG